MNPRLAAEVSAHLNRSVASRATHQRPDAHSGGIWLDHHCYFHDDVHRSASWQEDTQIYYCRVCTPSTRPAEEAYQKIVGELPPPGVEPEAAAEALLALTPPPASPRKAETWYEYRFPDGKTSHYVQRVDHLLTGRKDIRPYYPDRATVGKPEVYWPFYHHHLRPTPEQIVIIVEGEKCVDALQDKDPSLFALTVIGGSSQLRKHADRLAEFLDENPPAHILLWPDNDEPGVMAMKAVSTAFKRQGLEHHALSPDVLELPPKGDAFDYLAAGRELQDVFQILYSEPPIASARNSPELMAIVNRTLVVSGERLILEASRTVERIQDYAPYLWLETTGQMPSQRQQAELTLRLKAKSKTMPSEVAYRRHADEDGFWWRPTSSGGCWRVSAEGTETSDDPKDVFLAMTPGKPIWTSRVSEGDETAFRKALSLWGINELDYVMMKTWLICAFCDLQTPIMLFRGPAGTGKSTLARFLLGLLEPVCPEIHGLNTHSGDERGFYRALEVMPGGLLDNVSSLSPSFEDILSQLVTGMARPMRGLYTDTVEMIQIRRPMIMTTISWDVGKGDLASRCIAISPEPQDIGAYLSEEDAFTYLNGFAPSVRGYIWAECARYYRGVGDVGALATDFRIGSFGKVLATLGYDVAQLAREEAKTKSELVNQHDPWLESVVNYWEREGRGQKVIRVSTRELAEFLQDQGVENPPHAKSRVFHRYLEEKSMIFQDFGFRLRYFRTTTTRGWEFRRLATAPVPLEFDFAQEA